MVWDVSVTCDQSSPHRRQAFASALRLHLTFCALVQALTRAVSILRTFAASRAHKHCWTREHSVHTVASSQHIIPNVTSNGERLLLDLSPLFYTRHTLPVSSSSTPLTYHHGVSRCTAERYAAASYTAVPAEATSDDGFEARQLLPGH